MNVKIEPRVGSTSNWPLGLFISDEIFASILLGAIPTLQVSPVLERTLERRSSATCKHSGKSQ